MKDGLLAHIVINLQVADAELCNSLFLNFNDHKIDVLKVQKRELFPSQLISLCDNGYSNRHELNAQGLERNFIPLFKLITLYHFLFLLFFSLRNVGKDEYFGEPIGHSVNV
jgi:hypothetical protein